MKSLHYVKICLEKSRAESIAMIIFQAIVSFAPMIQVIVLTGLLEVINQFVNNEVQISKLINYALMYIGIYFFVFIVQQIYNIISIKQKNKVGIGFVQELLEKYTRIKYEILEEAEFKDLSNRVLEDADEKVQTGFTTLQILVGYFIELCSVSILIVKTSLWIGMFAVIILLLMAMLSVHNGKELYDSDANASGEFRRARYYRQVMSNRDNSAERKLFGFTSFIINEWQKRYHNARMISVTSYKKTTCRLAVASSLTFTFIGIAISLMAHAFYYGKVQYEAYISIITVIFQIVEVIIIYAPIYIERFIENELYIEDYLAYMTTPEDCRVENNNTPIESIEMRNLSFSYPVAEKNVFHNLNVKFEKGKTYAVVGENGAGKTTLLKILTGLYENYDGEILVNGEKYNKETYKAFRENFSCAFQNFAKYEMSIKNNIDPENNGTDNEYSEILSMVGMDKYISSLPNGIESILGKLDDNGIDVSGGQWQRLALARAFIHKASIRIFDEPTASMDPRGEAEIFDKIIHQKNSDEIKIFITHRLGCIKNVDLIFVLDEGKIAESGTFAELCEKRGIFASMYEKQKAWYI